MIATLASGLCQHIGYRIGSKRLYLGCKRCREMIGIILRINQQDEDDGQALINIIGRYVWVGKYNSREKWAKTLPQVQK